jgi:REP element-mobilizing transposase RayT
VKILNEVRCRYGFRLIGYVVMPEHVHLLLSEPKKGTPSKALQVLKQKVSRSLRGKEKKSVAGQLTLPFSRMAAEERAFWQRRF